MAWNSATLTHSTVRTLPSRAALTLAEVLIAMGILMIGLLGVASIFPVGGFYMQSGDIADQGGAIAQAALEDAIIRGHLDPENWIVHDLNGGGAMQGVFMHLVSGAAPAPSDLSQRHLGLRGAVDGSQLPPTIFGRAQNSKRSARSTYFGGAFVIDPIGSSSAMAGDGLNNQLVVLPEPSMPLRRFPAFSQTFTEPSGGTAWDAWQAAGLFWPVRRVTVVGEITDLNSNNSNNQFLRPFAASRALFTASDDPALTLPDDGDAPARQFWETWATGSSGNSSSVRQARGDYSWIISVAPATSLDRDQIGIAPDAATMEVSTVVFHKRTRALDADSVVAAERFVTARVVSSGPGGGELLLQRRSPLRDPSLPPFRQDPPELGSPFEDLREGQYVMVVGPHPLSTLTEPRLALRWCRVLNINDTGQPALSGLTPEQRQLSSETQVLAALRGADWPWQAATDLTDNAVANDLRVAILPGIVAVHTKTMRLEAGSEWSID